jgi:hypothetical protein
MENIKIIDNFLSKEELNNILTYIRSVNYEYNFKSGGNHEKFDNPNFVIRRFNEDYINNILKKIEDFSSKKFKIERSFMSIQVYGQVGAFHQDKDSVNEDYYSFCLYITDILDADMENADGDFLIKIPNENYIMCINTLMNRGVFFPSKYVHKGMAYNQFYNNMRFCITLQLKEII